jgi:alpha-tubulin suppressor-like RCC1 family protein
MSIAIKSDGTLWAWGQTYDGHLGNGVSAAGCRYTPQQIGTNFVSIASGFSYAIGLKDDGTLWSWGHLSIDARKTGADSLVPKQIGSGYSSIYMGAWRAFAIANDGSLWSWGDGHESGFSNTYTYASAPTKIR